MKRKALKARSNSGFSLLEMLLVIGILMILSGLATYGFISAGKNMRIKAAVQMVDSYLKGARQVSINTRSEHRVVIEMYRDPGLDTAIQAENIPVRMWIEKRKAEFLDWSTLAYDEYDTQMNPLELVSDIKVLPEFMRLSDLSGIDSFTLLRYTRRDDRLLLFFKFTSSGALEAYMNTDRMGMDLGSIVADAGERFTGGNTRSLFLHFCRANTFLSGSVKDHDTDEYIEYYYPGGTQGALYLDESYQPSRLNLGEVLNAGDKVLPDITGNPRGGRASPSEVERLSVERAIRHQVGTLQVVPLTGRTRAYDYGVGFPFSVDEIVEAAL